MSFDVIDPGADWSEEERQIRARRMTMYSVKAIEAMLTTAPGNGAPIGGLKVTTKRGWFAARPSGTENVYKIYAESFAGEEHLRRLQQEARELVSETFAAAGV